MRIAVYKDNLATGRGADAAVRNLASILAGAGHEISLVAQVHGLPLEGVATVTTTAADVLRDLERLKPDVVVSTGTNEVLDIYKALHTRLGREPVREDLSFRIIQQFHIYPPTMFKWKRPFRNRLIKRALRLAAATQVLLPSYIEPTRRAAGLGVDARIIAIGNSVTPHRPGALSRQKLIVYPAALNKDKRQDLLIKAFAIASRGREDWALELYGKGKPKYAAKLKKLIASLGLNSRARLMGYAKDLDPILSKASIVAFPSAMEGFGLVVLDAATFGIPVVGCRGTPGVSELIKDGENGLLSHPTPAAFAKSLSRLMESEQLRDTLGNAAGALLETYSVNNIKKAWLETILNVRQVSFYKL